MKWRGCRSERRGWRWWSLDTEIWAYRDQCEDCQLLRLKEEKMELEKKLSKMKQPAALPGHLGLQAAHLGRSGPGLLLQPIITSLAKSLLHVGQGGAKKTQVSDFQNGKAVSHP